MTTAAPIDTEGPFDRAVEAKEEESRSALGPIGLLLRNPAEVARRCIEEENLRPLVLSALCAMVIGAAVFGGVVGSFRGGIQIGYGAIKIPIALTAAILASIPAFHAIAASLGRAYPIRTVIALTVTSAGRAGLVLLAFAPVLWLAFDLGVGYHSAALAGTLAYALAGLSALGVILRGLGHGKHKITTALAFVLVFLAAAAQTGWMFRPYLVRPQTEEVPFVRAREGGVVDSLYRSGRSAVGVFDEAQTSIQQETWIECDAATAPAGGFEPGSRCYEYREPAWRGGRASPNTSEPEVRP
jgi:hypothetical protein